jgi:hypothetical protein
MSKIGLFCKKEGDTGNGEWIKLEKREREELSGAW